jgi:hypothetical protein
VYIVGDPEMFSFKFDTYHFNGENGRHGGSKLLQLTCMPKIRLHPTIYFFHRSQVKE